MFDVHLLTEFSTVSRREIKLALMPREPLGLSTGSNDHFLSEQLGVKLPGGSLPKPPGLINISYFTTTLVARVYSSVRGV